MAKPASVKVPQSTRAIPFLIPYSAVGSHRVAIAITPLSAIWYPPSQMTDTGQVTASAAEVYDEFFVPALFAPWAPRLVAAADVQPGDHVADIACGTGIVARLLIESAIPNPQVRRIPGQARFPSIRAWMHTDIHGWTLADKLDAAQYQVLLSEAEQELARFVTPTGHVNFEAPALIATARKQ